MLQAEMSAEASRRLRATAIRRAAKVGLTASRRRGRRVGPETPQGFHLLDETGNCIAGEGYSMSAEEVIAFCERIP